MKKFRNNHQNSSLLFYGKHPVFSAINNLHRQLLAVYCTIENLDDVKHVLTQTGRDLSILKVIERKDFDKFLPADAVHQGIAAAVQTLDPIPLEDICALSENQTNCHLLILDQVTDPQNIGAIIRSCVAFDALALVVQDKNSPSESGAMAKASAGMIEHLPIVRVTNLARAIDTLKQHGFWVIGMDGYAKTTIDKMDKSGKLAVIMGSEGSGMRRLIEESCDTTVRLPISEKVESLNVATAAAITLYELSKR